MDDVGWWVSGGGKAGEDDDDDDDEGWCPADVFRVRAAAGTECGFSPNVGLEVTFLSWLVGDDESCPADVFLDKGVRAAAGTEGGLSPNVGLEETLLIWFDESCPAGIFLDGGNPSPNVGLEATFLNWETTGSAATVDCASGLVAGRLATLLLNA